MCREINRADSLPAAAPAGRARRIDRFPLQMCQIIFCGAKMLPVVPEVGYLPKFKTYIGGCIRALIGQTAGRYNTRS